MQISPRGNDLAFLIFLILAVFFSGIYFCDQIGHAAGKPFWLDEDYTFYTIGDNSFGDIVRQGMRGQASKSPLDFLVVKGFVLMREAAGMIPEEIYYRLWPITVTSVSALAVILLLGWDLHRRKDLPCWTLVLSLFLLLLVLPCF